MAMEASIAGPGCAAAICQHFEGWKCRSPSVVRSSCAPPFLSLCSGQAQAARFGAALSCADPSGSGRQRCARWVCAAAAGGRDVYQPFRPPVTNLPAPGTVSPEEQLQILRERRGLWHEYALVIPFLTRAGYTPAQIDEATGVTGVEQNMIVGASQVRLSLIAGGMGAEVLNFFDVGGADLLYELRILSTDQRKASAELIVEKKMDPKEAKELARAVKDYDRRKREEGWGSFNNGRPGDYLAFACYRQSKEVRFDAEKEILINKGLSYAASDSARTKLKEALGLEAAPVSPEREEAVREEAVRSRLQVVRLPSKQDTENSPLPVILPVATDLATVKKAPAVGAFGDGPFNVYGAQPRWKTWLALPGWSSVVTSRAPIAVVFPDATILDVGSTPGTVARQGRNEPILLVVDKGNVDPEEDAYFLVEENQRLALRLGSKPAATTPKNSKTFGKVVVVLRPPLSEDEDAVWE